MSARNPLAWILAARPRTLPAAMAPVIVGAACAASAGRCHLGAAFAALIAAVLLQIGANFANDAFDFERGADGAGRVGPVRAAQAGILTPANLKRGMVAVFLAATLLGGYLATVAGPIIVILGVLAIAAAFAYTGGPMPLAYRGLGEVLVVVFFGFVAVCGTALACCGHVPASAWWASVPVGSLAAAILVANNIRDVASDARAGKRTVAVIFGENAARLEYALLLLVSFASVPVAYAMGGLGGWTLLTLGTVPLARRPLDLALSFRGAVLNECLAKTAVLLLVFSVVLACGIALG
ncbi:MAG TPA: 1,4-dihydroxy-2-naphthoate polyprenyltransferase [Kofleriaceae bacterium]|nr:1,4-dihydroxy-2-naphthoate polyprenyltransferase [Kofleriaceae bacterium]